MNKAFVSLLALLLALCTTGRAQELLRQLETREAENSTILLKSNLIEKESKSFTLPFIDDFSYSSHTPDSKKWINKGVYINRTYASNPPSIGVATFDALKADGTLYSDSMQYNGADTLSSVSIDLNYPNTAKIYLSFFYQPQGLNYVDAPEANDSLVLDFYQPVKNQWSRIWFAKGETSKAFTQVVIPITDTVYLHSGFQFRFRNVISYTRNDNDPGKNGNCDFWHIDYVKLAQNDTLINDIAISEPMRSMLNNYESIPWKHFNGNEAALSELSDSINLTVHNNNNELRSFDHHYYLREKISNKTISIPSSLGGGANIEANSTKTTVVDRLFSFESTNSDSAIFELKAVLSKTDPKDNKANDTVVYNQIFKNYYAYDDGSAEAGYGLSGQGTKYARIAMQFTTFAADTLQALSMYFNQALDNANQKAFYLTIWDDNNGVPGNILTEDQKIDKPIYASALNQFTQYQLNKPLFLEKGTYYIGWSQRYDMFLNIGFDINRNASSKLFYNIDGDWVSSSLKGAIMLRPYFGTQKEVITTDVKTTVLQNIKLYPNPANDYCQINTSNQPIKNIKVYDVTGRIQNVPFTHEGRIETSGLKNGIYLVNITVGTSTANLRLVVTR